MSKGLFGCTYKVVREVSALGNGNLLIEGLADVGECEVEIPGDTALAVAKMIMALAPKLTSSAVAGTGTVFHPKSIAVRAGQKPGECHLTIEAVPSATHVFAIPIGMLETLGNSLLSAAEKAKREQANSPSKPN